MPKFYESMREKLCRYALFRLIFRYEQIIRYIIVGGLTTGVNVLVYFLCTRVFFQAQFAANEALYATVFNWVSWAFAVIFAFFANRSFVFNESRRGGILLLQFGSFVLLRVGSGVVENFTPTLLIHLGMNDLVAKILVSFAVIILNFFFTKFVTFAKRKKPIAPPEATESDESPVL
jgi:putative flippase GtrA